MAPTQAPGFRVPSVTPLGISSHGKPWRPHPSDLLIPETLGVGAQRSSPAPFHAAVFCWLLFFPRPQSPMFPTQKPPVLPRVPIPPGTSASPYPVVVPKHDVTAEYPVDVQVPQRDVPRGDQGLLLHFLWENRGGGAGVRDTDPNLSVLGREPWGHHGVGTAKTSFLPLGGLGR